MENTRRKFLKKVAYTAPVVMALGTLTESGSLKAGTNTQEQTRSRIKKTR